MIQVASHETHISAQQNQARTDPRISCPHGHQGRALGVKTPSRERSRAVDTVTQPASVTTKDTHSGLTSGESNRFEKKNRLANAAAFGRVFEKATRSRDKLFTVLCRQNKEGTPRLGLAISKKHCRRATRRNRIKRIVRESFRQHQPLLTNLDIVVINQPAASGASHRQMRESLEGHWRQCGRATRSLQDS